MNRRHTERAALSACLWAAESLATAAHEDLRQENGNTTFQATTRPSAAYAETSATESKSPSTWTLSKSKRIFDCACVAAALPILIPLLLLVALSVRVTSRGPVLFLQKRVGRGGRPFTIVKFRTLYASDANRAGDLRFTKIGRFLRRWKLDELPQLFNVLAGDMSLVGPRPKMREYELENPRCRPGITGAATLVFAREEDLLSQFACLCSGDAYRTVVMPAKLRLDTVYMAQATFLSDLRLLASTLFHRWDMEGLQAILRTANARRLATEGKAPTTGRRKQTHRPGPLLPRLTRIASAEVASQI